MNEMPLFTDQELDEALMGHDERHVPEGNPEELLWQAMEEREMAVRERDKARQELAGVKNKLAYERTLVRKERELRVAAEKRKPLHIPVIAFFGSAVLAVLVIAATNNLLVADQLGEPLAFFFIGCCAFFSGMVWDRSDVAKKLQGQRKEQAYGNG